MKTSRRVVLFLSVLAVVIAPVAVAPAAQAAVPASPCSPRNANFVNIDDAGSYGSCSDTGTVSIHPCPSTLAFDPYPLPYGHCDFPEHFPVATTLTAGQASLLLVPLKLINLTATLKTKGASSFDGAAPIPGAKITFKAFGQTVCTATTGWDGTATCDTTTLVGTVDGLLTGYTAQFTSPLPTLASSQATGTVRLL